MLSVIDVFWAFVVTAKYLQTAKHENTDSRDGWIAGHQLKLTEGDSIQEYATFCWMPIVLDSCLYVDGVTGHVIYITSKIYFNFGSPFVSLIWIELKRKCIYYFKSATNHGILYHPSKADNLWIEARVLYPTPNILFDGKREIPEASRIP